MDEVKKQLKLLRECLGKPVEALPDIDPSEGYEDEPLPRTASARFVAIQLLPGALGKYLTTDRLGLPEPNRVGCELRGFDWYTVRGHLYVRDGLVVDAWYYVDTDLIPACVKCNMHDDNGEQERYARRIGCGHLCCQ